jgi:hypothetical protein
LLQKKCVCVIYVIHNTVQAMEAAAKAAAAAAAAGAHSSSSSGNATASNGTAGNGCNGRDKDPAACSPGRVITLFSGDLFGAEIFGYFARSGHLAFSHHIHQKNGGSQP